MIESHQLILWAGGWGSLQKINSQKKNRRYQWPRWTTTKKKMNQKEDRKQKESGKRRKAGVAMLEPVKHYELDRMDV